MAVPLIRRGGYDGVGGKSLPLASSCSSVPPVGDTHEAIRAALHDSDESTWTSSLRPRAGRRRHLAARAIPEPSTSFLFASDVFSMSFVRLRKTEP